MCYVRIIPFSPHSSTVIKFYYYYYNHEMRGVFAFICEIQLQKNNPWAYQACPLPLRECSVPDVGMAYALPSFWYPASCHLREDGPVCSVCWHVTVPPSSFFILWSCSVIVVLTMQLAVCIHINIGLWCLCLYWTCIDFFLSLFPKLQNNNYYTMLYCIRYDKLSIDDLRYKRGYA
jgi:hypothetical protein